MDEKLSEDRKQGLIKAFKKTLDMDALTNADGLMIIEILEQACEREKASLYEEYIAERLSDQE